MGDTRTKPSLKHKTRDYSYIQPSLKMADDLPFYTPTAEFGSKCGYAPMSVTVLVTECGSTEKSRDRSELENHPFQAQIEGRDVLVEVYAGQNSTTITASSSSRSSPFRWRASNW